MGILRTLVGFLATSLAAFAAYHPTIPGLVDKSFSGQVPVQGGYDFPKVVTVQPDGKVLVGTLSSLVRLNADGTPDVGFNLAASTISQGQGGWTEGSGFTEIMVEPSGRIVVAGAWTIAVGVHYIYNHTWRLNSDGTVDPSYTPHVIPQSQLIPASYDLIPQAWLSGGRYLTVGYPTPTGGPKIIRLNPDATVDTSFTPYSPPGANANSLALAQDSAGDVVVWATQMDNTGYIARLNGDGSFNTAFPPQILPHPMISAPYFVGSQNNLVAITKEIVSPNGTGIYHVQGVGFSYVGTDIPYGINYPEWIPPVAAAGSDGSLYVAIFEPGLGTSYDAFQGAYHDGLIRLDPTGKFDPSYALNVDQSFTLDPQPAFGLTGLANGQLLMWGAYALFNGESSSQVTRINPQAGDAFSSLVNLSALAPVGPGAQSLTVGMVTSGPGTVPALVRAVGPTLAAFGVTTPMANPTLTLYSADGSAVSTDDNWQDGGQGAAIAAAAVIVGAFPLPNGSLDAAALATLGPGAHSVTVQGSAGGSGNVLVEVYEAAPTAIAYGSARTTNLSFRGSVQAGAPLTAGFVVEGKNNKRVLIRAVGPGLAAFGIANPLADPVLTLYSGAAAIASNQGWGDSPLLRETFTGVGAFPFANGNSDSACAITLSAGAYTAQVTSASGGSGSVLVEIYEVP